MKTLVTILSLLTGTLALAQKPTYTQVNTSVNENNNNELAIQVSAERADGQQVRYSRTFDVRGLSKQEKEALKNHVLDSLGVTTALPAPPVAPPPPKPQAGVEVVKVVCASCTGSMRLTIQGNGFNYTRTHDDTEDDKKEKAFADIELEMKPGEYRLTYWQNKVLQMQTAFTVRAGAKNVVTVK